MVLDVAQRPASAWPALAQLARQWLADRGLAEREAIVLLPFTQLLPLARRAFGAQDGWQPQAKLLGLPQIQRNGGSPWMP